MQLGSSGALALIQLSVWKGEILKLDKVVQEISEAGELYKFHASLVYTVRYYLKKKKTLILKRIPELNLDSLNFNSKNTECDICF